jgi:hypothetical protein
MLDILAQLGLNNSFSNSNSSSNNNNNNNNNNRPINNILRSNLLRLQRVIVIENHLLNQVTVKKKSSPSKLFTILNRFLQQVMEVGPPSILVCMRKITTLFLVSVNEQLKEILNLPIGSLRCSITRTRTKIPALKIASK